MADLVVPKGFNWESSRNVDFTIRISDTRFDDMLHSISIYDGNPLAGGKLLSKGAASLNEAFRSIIYIPKTIRTVYIVKTSPDNSSITESIEVTGSTVSLVLGAVVSDPAARAMKATKLATIPVESPDCTGGCDEVVTRSMDINTNGNKTVCVTGSNITIGINANNGIIKICGSNVKVSYANLNNKATLIVTKTGSVTFSNLNQNGQEASFVNYGNSTINGNYSVIGEFMNFGTLTVNGELNLNTNVATLNNGTINVASTFNVNAANTFINNNKVITKDFTLNSSSVLYNTCYLWAKGNLTVNSLVKNYNLIRVDGLTNVNNNYEIGLYNGAMFKTTNLTLDGVLKGYGSTSFAKVTANTTIRNGGVVRDAVQFCDENGIETGANAFAGGATKGCDLYIPISSCNPEGNGTVKVIDRDGDGVADALDEYPDDASRAFNNFYPSSAPDAGETIAFEDNWPFKGDYDLNDLIMSYRYKIVTNAQNKVVQVQGDYTLHATGGNFGNGFGVEFPVARSKVTNLTGATLETGQDNAVVILFTNMRVEMDGWNTKPGEGTSAVKAYNVSFNVDNGPLLNAFGLGSYNPFVWNDGQGEVRGSEIHLPGKTPTKLAKTSLFGTVHDRSNPAAGIYYVTENGLPWAITVPVNKFAYSKEGTDIVKSYSKFALWAQSGGTQFLDWYSNPDYRNTDNIFGN